MGMGLGYCCCGGAGTCGTMCLWAADIIAPSGLPGADNTIVLDGAIGAIGATAGFVVDGSGFTQPLLNRGVMVTDVGTRFFYDDGTHAAFDATVTPETYDGCLIRRSGLPGAGYYNYLSWQGTLHNSAFIGARQSISVSVQWAPWRAAADWNGSIAPSGPKNSDPCLRITISVLDEVNVGQSGFVRFYVMDRFCKDVEDVPNYDPDNPQNVYVYNQWGGTVLASYQNTNADGSHLDTGTIYTRTLTHGLQIFFGPTHPLFPNTSFRLGLRPISVSIP